MNQRQHEWNTEFLLAVYITILHAHSSISKRWSHEHVVRSFCLQTFLESYRGSIEMICCGQISFGTFTMIPPGAYNMRCALRFQWLEKSSTNKIKKFWWSGTLWGGSDCTRSFLYWSFICFPCSNEFRSICHIIIYKWVSQKFRHRIFHKRLQSM